jgi:hypothetical protein
MLVEDVDASGRVDISKRKKIYEMDAQPKQPLLK